MSNELKVEELMKMGYEQFESEEALSKAGWSLQGAIELLTS